MGAFLVLNVKVGVRGDVFETSLASLVTLFQSSCIEQCAIT